MTDFHPAAVAVRSPATCANLGPGFDALGLCVGLYDDLTAAVTSSGLTVDVTGQGAAEIPHDERHLVVRSLRAALDLLEVPQPGLALATTNRIPHGRGLGSSAAAIVAGIRLAQGLVPGASMPDRAALALAGEIEGHPDNVAACLLGGLTVAWTSIDGFDATRLDVDRRVRVTVLVPPHAVSTEAARAVLPPTVPHADAAGNAGRAALLVAALTRQPDLLFVATEDLIHQSYRGQAMPQTLAVVEAFRDRGIAAAVSGAGPSVLVLTTGDGHLAHADLVPAGWSVLDLPIDPSGCRRQA
jgi:homoserine kinase